MHSRNHQLHGSQESSSNSTHFLMLQFTQAVISKLTAKCVFSAQWKALLCYRFESSTMQFAFNPSQSWSFHFTVGSLNKWGSNHWSVYFLPASGSCSEALWFAAQSNTSLSHTLNSASAVYTAKPDLLRLFMNKAMCYLGLFDKLVLRTRGNWNTLDLVLSKEDLTTRFKVVKIS